MNLNTLLKTNVPKRLSSQRRGFTLVELLATVMIVGILVVLLFLAVNSFVARAHGATCAVNMRSVATALFAYRGDHSGWFPPGYPAAPRLIGDQANFNSTLVPEYLDELPLCPAARLSPDQRKRYPNTKARYQALGGTYGINAILLQCKLEAMPPPGWDNRYRFSASKMVFLLEVGSGSATWSQVHQNQALKGVDGSIMGRNHGRGDTLNFMFLDGHIEAISRNDSRDVDEDKKSWIFDTNPNGKFHPWGKNGLYIDASRMNDQQFSEAYPN